MNLLNMHLKVTFCSWLILRDGHKLLFASVIYQCIGFINAGASGQFLSQFKLDITAHIATGGHGVLMTFMFVYFASLNRILLYWFSACFECVD